jgi:hypothetical protein
MNYNGWTNYATWRVALEFFDGFEPRDVFENWDNWERCHQANRLEEMVENHIEESRTDDMLSGWLAAFLSDVNFVEIARKFDE